jgi:two-component system, NtrC family, nitrogen regulation sensor histidine kinase NtrY
MRERNRSSQGEAETRERNPLAAGRGLDLGWIGGWAAILALAVWMSRLAPIWLVPAAVGSAVWTATAVMDRGRGRLPGALVLWLAFGIAGGVQLRLSQIIGEWPDLRHRVEENAAEALADALDGLVDAGQRAVAGAAEAAEQEPGAGSSPALFQRLDELRQRTGVSAIALFEPAGSTIGWAGEHRGSVPLAARQGIRPYLFHEGPLFSYLYFVQPLPNGVTATAAFLVEASVEAGEGIVPFAERFEHRHGTRPRFWTPERAPDDAVWDWATDDGPILTVSFAALTQQHWWERVVERGRRAAGGATLIGVLTLGIGWYRTRPGAPGVPVVVGTAALLLAPLGRMTGAESLFSPLQFVLPGRLDITLGVLLVICGGAAVWLLIRVEPEVREPVSPWAAAFGIALVYPAVVTLVDRSAADGLLAARAAGGFAVQLAATLLIAIPVYLLLSRTRGLEIPPRTALLLRTAGYLLPALLGIGLISWWGPDRPMPFAAAALWAFPTLLLLAAPIRPVRARGSLRIWLIAGWLAGTATLAFLWPLHVRAEMNRAERELTLLGTDVDPYLDFLLRQFEQEANRLAADGERGVNLLYHSWIGSGLAREGYEARVTQWRDGVAEAELNLSDLAVHPDRAIAEIAAERSQTSVIHYGGIDGLHYLLVVPLADGSTASVAVPPRRHLGGATSLARFLNPGREARFGQRDEALYLFPVDAVGPSATHSGVTVRADTVHWVRTDRGWRSETLIEMPGGTAHAHMTLRMPSIPLLLVRATLVLSGILLTLFGLWLAARLACRDIDAVPLLRARWLQSFRGRLSLALFVFFLLPTLVFGAVSYGAVTREVVRSAAALAYQALDQAAARLPDATLPQLGATVQNDLLLYRNGALVGATAPEVLELGLFHTWLPPAVFLRFAGGEDLQELEARRLAESDYLVAYRRIDPVSVLAAPIPLASNEITRRQREFRDIALLVTLLGLGLSMVLSLLVSRALASPLDELSHAALTVGAGDLRTRLPETRSDEFGSVYHSFNRMVGRLDRTRAALVQETRRTETIVAEAATGVLALDSQGRVELINPRAAEILGGKVETGDPLLAPERANGQLSAAIADLWRSPSAEAGTELELDGRTIRMKLRRLSGEGLAGGAVIALEDVTAELRTARVLAWGEMARQVAHEIKNPLTPIKLAVQHVRRAFLDQRPDFDRILDRNVESILREIDRLSEISRAFSRFGSPPPTESALETVDVNRAIGEILALYGGSDGRATIRSEIAAGYRPLAIARTGELKEVLLNLLENAREAVEPGGEVVVTSESADQPGWLSIVVRDDGVGIPADQLPSIFEPHFSTRSSGTGLGLAIVRRIVDSWGGTIRAESVPGTGTSFEILIHEAAQGAVAGDPLPAERSSAYPDAGRASGGLENHDDAAEPRGDGEAPKD